MSKITKSHNPRSIFQNLLKVYQVIYLVLPIYSLSFKATASIVFLDFADKVKMPKITKGP